MDARRFLVLVSAAALVAPLTGWASMPAAASGPAPTAVPASVCFPSTDNGDPVLRTLAISPRAVDTRAGSQDVTFTVTADDTGGPGAPSGVASGTAFVAFDAGGDRNLSAPMKPDGKGAMVGTLTILPQFRTATRFVSLSLEDADGNSTTYSTADLDQMGLPTTFTTTTTPDTGPPAVTTVRLSTATIDTRRTRGSLGIRVHATDDSGVAGIDVALWGSPIRSSVAHLRRVDGKVTDGTWQGRVRVPRWQGNSTAKLAVEVFDFVGGDRIYGPKKLAALGQPGTVRVLSRKDPAPPTLRLRSVTPTSLDLRTGAQSVTVEARVTDRGSGARQVVVDLAGPDDGDGGTTLSGRLQKVSGTTHDGVWRGTVTLHPCSDIAGQWSATLFAVDSVGSNYLSAPKAFTVLAADNRRPTAQVPGDSFRVRRGGPLTVEFDEDVVGVDAQNALVHVGDGQRGRADDDPAPIAGTWACTDGSDVAVDCAAGPVRTAAFTPTTPMLPSTNHTLVLNPEHRLGLTDLAGNPYQPTRMLSFHTS